MKVQLLLNLSRKCVSGNPKKSGESVPQFSPHFSPPSGDLKSKKPQTGSHGLGGVLGAFGVRGDAEHRPSDKDEALGIRDPEPAPAPEEEAQGPQAVASDRKPASARRPRRALRGLHQDGPGVRRDLQDQAWVYPVRGREQPQAHQGGAHHQG